jgi:hypothetical protein
METPEPRVVKVVPVLHLALQHEDVQGSGCLDPHFLALDTSWR